MERQKYYPKLKEYYNTLEDFPQCGWGFDFISIHRDRYPHNPMQPFSLVSPLMLCGIKRLRFEDRQFETFDDAKRYALRLCEVISRRWKVCHVVSCCNESLEVRSVKSK
jgi:hypothetical protein